MTPARAALKRATSEYGAAVAQFLSDQYGEAERTLEQLSRGESLARRILSHADLAGDFDHGALKRLLDLVNDSRREENECALP